MTAEIVTDILVPPDSPTNQIACTHLSNGYLVSTIEITPLGQAADRLISMGMDLLGITLDEMAEHTEAGFRADLATPGSYETMVFPCDDDGEATSMEEQGFQRYMSREEAEEGHREMVEKWRER